MNLLGKLFYVYWVNDPNGEEDDEIVVSCSHQDFLGHSKVIGIFRWQPQAEKFAAVQTRQLQRGRLNWRTAGEQAA